MRPANMLHKAPVVSAASSNRQIGLSATAKQPFDSITSRLGLKIALFNPLISKKELHGLLKTVAQERANGGRFLPSFILNYISCPYFYDSCFSTKSYFIAALESGTLIKTTAEIEGLKKGEPKRKATLYIKGVLSDTGNKLAYDPTTNQVHSIMLCDGNLTVDPQGMQPFKDNKFQKMILAAESGAL